MKLTDVFRNTIIQGDALSVLKKVPSDSVDCCVSSPPYFHLRDYGVKGQLGQELTPQQYVSNLCDVYYQVKRVLKPGGTCFVNLGDTHDDKCLLQIPYRFSIAMTDCGWILRNMLVWKKPSCMPSSSKDRFTVDYEPYFFFTKNGRYYFEQQFEPHAKSSIKRAEHGWDCDRANNRQGVHTDKMGDRFVGPHGRNKRCVWSIPTKPFQGAHFAVMPPALVETPIKAGCPQYVCDKCGEPRRRILERVGMSSSDYMKGKDKSRWQSEQGQKQSMRAPRAAFDRLIKDMGWTDCGCKDATFHPGIVLDPFMGSGTVGLVAKQLGRDYLGIDLNPKYIKLANKRLK